MPSPGEAVWKALGDPVRRELLDSLRRGPKTTGALCELFTQSRFGVMKHLGVLHGAGLISVERRGRERWNYLNAVTLKLALDRWITPFQEAWAGSFANLAQSVAEDADVVAVPDNMLLDIRQESVLPATTKKVFDALTKRIDRWWQPPYRQTVGKSSIQLTAEIGASMVETGPDGHEVIWARVEEVHAPTLLLLSGRFAVKGALAGRVQFELSPSGRNACRLVVTHQAIGPITEEAKASFTAGWVDLIDKRLRAHLQSEAK